MDDNFDHFIKSDENRISQIVLCLLQNSIKFTDQGSIIISAKVDELERYLTISVKDTGIGISVKNQ